MARCRFHFLDLLCMKGDRSQRWLFGTSGRAGTAIGAATAASLSLLLPFAPHVKADTSAHWAWPGMRYDIFAAGSWHSCSVGYPAWDSAGTKYFITAGHCFRDESGRHYMHPDGTDLNIYSPTDHTKAVGFERIYPKPGDGRYTDVSLVQMYPGRQLRGTGWEHIPDHTTTADVGDTACLTGFKHDTSTCGKVTDAAVDVTITGFSWSTSVTEASYCAHPGDSGGAVYNRNGALGIEITGSLKHNEPGTSGTCKSAFIPIAAVLKYLRRNQPTLTI